MVAGPRNNKMKSSPAAKTTGGGKTMGELGLTRDQMKKAYPWGGRHSSPSK